MCDKKNNVLFTDTEFVVLNSNSKLLDERQVLISVPRKNNMSNVDLRNVASSEGLTCLFAKVTLDESNLWHKRLEHINFKTMNKLVRGNLVRGLPSKIFENNHTCVACQKGKKHKASCKTKTDQRIFDSGCSRHMTGNKSFLLDYEEIDGRFVAFAGSPKRGKITGKVKTRTGKLDFEDVDFVNELKFNFFSVSQMCDKKNNVLFTETECLIPSPDFKLLDESQILFKVHRQDNMYCFDLKNVVPLG
nr:ribonuclease H-like domain-containing protein [Tanacetum cinerariifolium]